MYTSKYEALEGEEDNHTPGQSQLNTHYWILIRMEKPKHAFHLHDAQYYPNGGCLHGVIFHQYPIGTIALANLNTIDILIDVKILIGRNAY